jgi:hypothetical protein
MGDDYAILWRVIGRLSCRAARMGETHVARLLGQAEKALMNRMRLRARAARKARGRRA